MSQQINLFNPVFLKKKRYFSAVTMGQALGLILAGSLALAGYLAYQSRALEAEAAAAAAQLAGVQAQLAQIENASQARKKNTALDEGIKKAEGETRLLQRVFNALDKGEIGSTKGYAEYFRAFARQIVPGLWLTGLTVHGNGNEIGIQGRSLQPQLVPEYLGRLKREETLKGKSFATLEMQQPKTDRKADAADAADASQAAGKSQVPANYVEFSIQSADLARAQGNAPGGSGK